MTTKISEANIQDATLDTLLNSGGGGPKISSIIVTNSNYVNLDDTAVALEGGFVKLIGSGFAAGCQVLVGLTPALSVTYISETEVRAQVPTTAAGTYIVYLVNTDGGTAIRVNAVTFSGTPTWVSGSTLAAATDTVISIQLTATDATTFALAVGSTLPPGITLSSGGLLSGTITGITEETVYNFVINAVDAELQDSPRSFAFTVTAGDQFFAATTLLLPGSATTFVRDASTNNFPVTVFGDTRPNTFNPYLTGWSNYFDGSGDLLSIPDNDALEFGSTDYTIEAWIYMTGFAAAAPAGSPSSVIVAKLQNTTNSSATQVMGMIFSISGTTASWTTISMFQYSNNAGTGNTISASTTFNNNQWYHVAVTRNSNSVRLFVNGTQVGSTVTFTVSQQDTNIPLTIGGINFVDYPYNFPGYISNVRIVKGTAVYTANFTSPTQPLTAIAGTSLLTCQSNRSRDASTNAFAITRNGDVAVRSFSPFQEPPTTRGSGFFDGNGDYITVGNSNLALNTGDFTLECWINADAGLTDKSIFEGRTAGSGTTGFTLTAISPTSIRIFSGSGLITSGSINYVRTWCHVAVVRLSGTTTLYINGVGQGTTTALGNLTDSLFVIGGGKYASPPAVDAFFTGYISNLRIVKGTAVYTAAFTPPTAPLTAVANTSLLTLQNNQPTNNSMFLDSSSNNMLVTRFGNTTQGSFSPYSPSGWSNYFDGSGDFLSVGNNAALNLSGGDFTVEAWIYLTALPAADPDGNRTGCILVYGSSTTNQGYTLNVNLTSNTINMQSPGTGNWARASFTFALGTWYHVAATRSGSTDRLFVNGQSLTLTANTFPNNSSATGTLKIGSERLFGAYNIDFPGYISNVRIVKGTAVYTANFTPSTTPLTAIPGTSLLTCADNRFIDDSVNNFVITRNGDTRVTNFSPFRAQTQTPTTYSAFFDGTGDYLTYTNSNQFAFGTGSFTIEFWINAPLNNNNFILGGRSSIGAMHITTGGFESTAGVLRYAGSSAIVSSNVITDNTWHHCAIVRNGSSAITLYVDGVSVGTGSDTTNYTTTTGTWVVGTNDFDFPTNANTNNLTGYLSNLRIVRGTAVYTANFTPSTTPLTAIANTSLLTCQSATFADNSSNRSAITAAGNSQPSMVNPFGSTFTNSIGYTAAESGGSMYFDGTGDYVDSVTSSAFTFGTGNFTIEFWAYFTAISGSTPNLVDLRGGTHPSPRPTIYMDGGVLRYFTAGANRISGPSLVANAWHHIALCRNLGTTRLFVNGTQVGASFADTTNYTSTKVRVFASDDGTPVAQAGYCSNLRILNGAALYTSNFAPPLAPVEPVPNTVLLLNGTAAAIGDATTRNVLETVGDARISTVQSKWGGSSMAFDGTGDYLTIPSSINLEMDNANFTYECWVYPTASSLAGLICKRPNSSTGFAGANLDLNGLTPRILITTSGSSWATTNSSSINVTLNTWSHVALTRLGNTVTIWVNGVSGTTATISGAVFANTNNMTIGARAADGSGLFTGYMQDVRITKGIARYTANFTPPTTAFQTR